MKFILKWNLPGGPMYFYGFSETGRSLWTISTLEAKTYDAHEVIHVAQTINSYEGINLDDLETELI